MLPEPLLKWSSWPFMDRKPVSLLLCSFILLITVLLWNITVVQWQTPWYFIVGIVLFISSLLPYFIQTDYEIFEDRIHIRYLFVNVSRQFKDFGCFYRDKHGVMLSTFAMPRRLDSFRGQSLRFSKTRAEVDELMRILEQKIGKKY